jgi:hypothetical protein
MNEMKDATFEQVEFNVKLVLSEMHLLLDEKAKLKTFQLIVNDDVEDEDDVQSHLLSFKIKTIFETF